MIRHSRKEENEMEGEKWEHYPNPHLIELRAWAEKYAQNNLLSLTVDWNEFLEEQWGEERG